MTDKYALSRRGLLRGSLAVGALTAVGLPALTGCSNEDRGTTGSQAQNDSVQLPDYLPYAGVAPDLIGEGGVSNGYLAYPANPPSVTDGPPGDGQPVGVLTISNSPAPPTVDHNSFWQELNRRLGCDLSISLVNSGDYSERFQTAVAGDQLPELFSFFPSQIPQLPALLNERAVDLTPMLSGGAIADYPFLASIPTESWQQTVFGGKIYGIPIARGAASSATLYVRDDLLAERDIASPPDSWESFYDSCVQATSTQANSWALTAVPMAFLRQMFGVPNQWSDEGGQLVSAHEAERQTEALEAGRRLVADGLVHPDAFGVDGNQRKLWLINGTSVFLEGTFSAWLGFHEQAEPNDIGVTAYAPPPLADGGGNAQIWLADPTHNVTSISAKAEDRAEALLDLLNYFSAPFGTAEHLFNAFGLPDVHHVLNGTDPQLTELGRSETKLSLTYLGQGPYTIHHPGYPHSGQAVFDAMSASVPSGLANPALGLFSDTLSRKGSQLSGALADAETDILTGRSPVSSWTDAVATWKSDGGDAIREELQMALDERRGD